LLKLELPQWMLRRLIYDDGEWHCSLSKHPALPVELDDSIEAVHEHPALALLSALVEARRISAAKADVRPPSVPQGRATPGHIVRQLRLMAGSRRVMRPCGGHDPVLCHVDVAARPHRARARARAPAAPSRPPAPSSCWPRRTTDRR